MVIVLISSRSVVIVTAVAKVIVTGVAKAIVTAVAKAIVTGVAKAIVTSVAKVIVTGVAEVIVTGVVTVLVEVVARVVTAVKIVINVALVARALLVSNSFNVGVVAVTPIQQVCVGNRAKTTVAGLETGPCVEPRLTALAGVAVASRADARLGIGGACGWTTNARSVLAAARVGHGDRNWTRTHDTSNPDLLLRRVLLQADRLRHVDHVVAPLAHAWGGGERGGERVNGH